MQIRLTNSMSRLGSLQMLSPLRLHIFQSSLSFRRTLSSQFLHKTASRPSRAFSVPPARRFSANNEVTRRSSSQPEAQVSQDRTHDEKTEASTSAQSISPSTHSASLPAPPPRPKGWPTPWLTQREFEQYIIPLNSQGWAACINTFGSRRKVAQLYKKFRFEHIDQSLKFLSQIEELSKKEKVRLSGSFTRHPAVCRVLTRRYSSV